MGRWNCERGKSPHHRILRPKSSPYDPQDRYSNIGWAISTGPESKYNGIPDLKGSAIGISRIGRFVGMFVVDISGSYVMPYVLADQNSWLEKGKDPFDFKVLNTFESMINSVRFVT
jgi:hypothetical protein